jgi:hypothetical protein
MGKLLIMESTGEVVSEMMSGDRIVRKKSVDYLKSVQVWKVDHFYKGNLQEISKWMRSLTPHEKAVLFTVSPWVGYEDCCLKHENGNMVSFDDIVRESCLSRGAVSKTINSLIKKDILYRGKNSKERQYFMNPWFFSKGNRINLILKTMFQNYRIKVEKNVKWKDLKE